MHRSETDPPRHTAALRGDEPLPAGDREFADTYRQLSPLKHGQDRTIVEAEFPEMYRVYMELGAGRRLAEARRQGECCPRATLAHDIRCRPCQGAVPRGGECEFRRSWRVLGTGYACRKTSGRLARTPTDGVACNGGVACKDGNGGTDGDACTAAAPAPARARPASRRLPVRTPDARRARRQAAADQPDGHFLSARRQSRQRTLPPPP